jgi:hypothetical protein
MSDLTLTIEFNTLANLKKFLRNYNAGKGTNLSQKNVVIHQDGEGFGDLLNRAKKGVVGLSRNQAIKNMANKVGKELINQGVNQLAQNQQYGMYAPLAGQLAQQQLNAMTGQGLISNALNKGKNALKTASKSKIGRKLIKDIGQQVINQGVNQLAQNEQFGMLAPVARQLAEQKLNSLTSEGEGFMDFVNKAGKALKKVPIKNIAKVVTPLVANSVASSAMLTGNPVAGMVAREAIMQGSRSLTGGSIIANGQRRGGRLVKGSAEAKAYMASIRARKGGSIKR